MDLLHVVVLECKLESGAKLCWLTEFIRILMRQIDLI